MRKHLRRYGMGAMAAGALAGVAAFALPHQATTATWQPVPYGLAETPAQLLPANVTTDMPVRVVGTTLDGSGKPVVTVHTATDKATATALVQTAQHAQNAVAVELDAPMTALDLGSGGDPYRAQQWDLTKLKVTDAWTKSTGAGVTVAVIDTGVDAGHPDLAGQILTGYDVITGTTGAATDPNGHGTHVAGTIAALTGNNVGVGSVAPNARILPIRVLGANGGGYMSDAATGIVYAADHGANVINMSLGSTAKVAAVSNAIAYARSKGVTVVAAAGNERASGSPTSYPAADAGVIAVAATDSADRVASYSNAGTYVDVAAPGSGIVSTVPTAKGGYGSMSGTSMASPHVAAAAALLKAYNRALTPEQVEAALEGSATDLGAVGRDNDYGYGRIDLVAALAKVTPATNSPSASPSATKTAAPNPTATTTSPTSTSPTSTSPTSTRPTSTSPTSTSPSPTPSRSAVVKVRPTVTLSTQPQEVPYGSTATVTFTVTSADRPWSLRPVSVCVAESSTSAFKCTPGTTSVTGTVTVQRTATGTFTSQLLVTATDASEAVTSAVATTRVRATLAVTRENNVLTVRIGGAAGQTVQVQRQDGTRWLTVLTYRAVSQATIGGLTTGQSFRLVVADSATLLGATSATV
jgi:type VII secretion-associated serine protease mycosin